jgi:DNA-binding beta-propeller fold protein YncE
VDRFDLTPDGSTIYLPAGEESTSDFWTIINAATGAAEGRIIGPSSSHDTIVSANGQYAYLEGQEKGPEGSQFHHSIAVVDTATNQVVKTIGPFNNVVRPFTVNASNTLVYVTENNFIGFQIGSVTTGKVLFTVPVPGRNQDLTDGQIVNHGIAITPDGNYIYLVDSSRDGVYVFDVAGAANGIAPTYVGFIPTRKPGDNPAGQPDPSQTDDPTGLPGWIMSSYQGQYMYTEGGDIISTATNTVVGNLRAGSVNSAGQTVPGDYIHSGTMIEVDFNNGIAVRTSDQFGIGHD